MSNADFLEYFPRGLLNFNPIFILKIFLHLFNSRKKGKGYFKNILVFKFKGPYRCSKNFPTTFFGGPANRPSVLEDVYNCSKLPGSLSWSSLQLWWKASNLMKHATACGYQIELLLKKSPMKKKFMRYSRDVFTGQFYRHRQNLIVD